MQLTLLSNLGANFTFVSHLTFSSVIECYIDSTLSEPDFQHKIVRKQLVQIIKTNYGQQLSIQKYV